MRSIAKSTACLVLISSLIGLTSLPGEAKKQSAAAQNFLPPVAMINNSLTLEDLEPKETGSEDSLGPVVFSAVSSPTLKLSDRPSTLQTTIQITKSTEQETLIQLQQKLDERDLKSLWDATVDQNPVIRFSLEKLALPIDLHAKHSSRFLNKTLAAMLNGAAMGAMMAMPAAGAYQNMGLATASQAAQNVLLGNNKPQVNPLTATEQIQLAGLIDDLKADLVQNYQNYKKTLEQLAQARAVSLKNNNLYASALKSPNPLARMAAGSGYYKAMLNETALRQRALVYRLKLERLAGKQAVNQLQLAVMINAPTIASTQTSASDIEASSVHTSSTIQSSASNNTAKLSSTAQQLPLAPLENILPTNKELIGPSFESANSEQSINPENIIGPTPVANITSTTNQVLGGPLVKKTDSDATPLSPIAEPSLDSPPVPVNASSVRNVMKGIR